MASTCSIVLVVLITLLFPPVGVAIVAGCGADVLINILLTLLGYIPGHVHAFYILYTYYSRQERTVYEHAPPEHVQPGGGGYAQGYAPAAPGGYGTVKPQHPPPAY